MASIDKIYQRHEAAEKQEQLRAHFAKAIGSGISICKKTSFKSLHKDVELIAIDGCLRRHRRSVPDTLKDWVNARAVDAEVHYVSAFLRRCARWIDSTDTLKALCNVVTDVGNEERNKSFREDAKKYLPSSTIDGTHLPWSEYCDRWADQVAFFRNCIRDSSAQEFTVFFPICDKDRLNDEDAGAVVSARIAAIERPRKWSAKHNCVLAPWTFFTMPPNSWFNLALQGALEASLPETDRVGRRFDESCFIVSMEPVGLGTSREADLLVLLPSMMEKPPEDPLGIDGDSLQLPICLGAAALRTAKRLRNVVATGAISIDRNDSSIKIGSVGGIAPKAVAVLLLQKVYGEPVVPLFPDANHSDAKRYSESFLYVESFAALIADSDRILTDGFDGFRNALLESVDVFGEQMALSVGDGEDEVLDTEMDDIQQRGGQVAEAIGRVPLNENHEPYLFCTPAGVDPARVAAEIGRELLAKWRTEITTDGLHPSDATVVIPVSMQTLMDEWDSEHSPERRTDEAAILTRSLQRLLARKNGGKPQASAWNPGVSVDADAITTALRLKGKLLLLIADLPMLEWYKLDRSGLAVHKQIRSALRALMGAIAQSVQPQTIVVVAAEEQPFQLWKESLGVAV